MKLLIATILAFGTVTLYGVGVNGGLQDIGQRAGAEIENCAESCGEAAQTGFTNQPDVVATFPRPKTPHGVLDSELQPAYNPQTTLHGNHVQPTEVWSE